MAPAQTKKIVDDNTPKSGHAQEQLRGEHNEEIIKIRSILSNEILFNYERIKRVHAIWRGIKSNKVEAEKLAPEIEAIVLPFVRALPTTEPYDLFDNHVGYKFLADISAFTDSATEVYRKKARFYESRTIEKGGCEPLDNGLIPLDWCLDHTKIKDTHPSSTTAKKGVLHLNKKALWVAAHIFPGNPWRPEVLKANLGNSVPVTAYGMNSRIIKGYYYPEANVTIYVNILKGTYLVWRVGKGGL